MSRRLDLFLVIAVILSTDCSSARIGNLEGDDGNETVEPVVGLASDDISLLRTRSTLGAALDTVLETLPEHRRSILGFPRFVAIDRGHLGIVRFLVLIGLWINVFVCILQFLLALLVGMVCFVIFSVGSSVRKGGSAFVMTAAGSFMVFQIVLIYPIVLFPLHVIVTAITLCCCPIRDAKVIICIRDTSRCRCLRRPWMACLTACGMGIENQAYHKSVRDGMWWNPWCSLAGALLCWDKDVETETQEETRDQSPSES
eukprot:TRINITY_DN24236_c0_g1_i1.p1 TRINITY_DN24236_c0_g1~~TRINITY_DN24236_c0_g1_i1.p1  ORF type:complete len:257 (+),score=13.13 TRINITY_DN24236_c0_g1_i1:204-974(+)